MMDYIKLGELLFTKDILPTHIGLTSRQINYWKAKKMLPFLNDVYGKHGRMNAAEAIWLLIIKELSDMGISTTRLSHLSKDVFVKPKEEKYADKVLKLNVNSKRQNLSEADIENLEALYADENIMEVLREELCPYTDCLKSAIIVSDEPHYLIYAPATGQHKFVCESPETVMSLMGKFSNQSIVCIPLFDKIAKVISLDISSSKKDLNYLSAVQNQIRDIVIFKKPKVVSITSDNDIIKTRTITEKHVRSDEIADFFIRNKIPKGTRLLIDPRSQDNYKLTLITK